MKFTKIKSKLHNFQRCQGGPYFITQLWLRNDISVYEVWISRVDYGYLQSNERMKATERLAGDFLDTIHRQISVHSKQRAYRPIQCVHEKTTPLSIMVYYSTYLADIIEIFTT